MSRESATHHYFPILEPALTGTDRWRTGAWQLKDYCEKYIFLEFLPI